MHAARLGQFGWNSFGPSPMLPGLAPFAAPGIATDYSWNRFSSVMDASPSAWGAPIPMAAAPASGVQCYTCSNGNPSDNKFNVTDMDLVKAYRADGYRCTKTDCVERGGSAYGRASSFGTFGNLFSGGRATGAMSSEIYSPSAPFSKASMMGNRRLGESTPPLKFSYADAVTWLASAEAIVKLSPICELPIVARFRDFIAKTPAAAQPSTTLTLTPDDEKAMADFVACVEKTKSHVADYDWKITDHTPELIGTGIAAALLAWLILS